jgi:hypothetical protein
MTCGELFALAEKTSTKTRLSLIALTNAPAQDCPGGASRGAIQQRIFLLSRVAHTASAAALSRAE